jgi:undecaprenyl-diphosphatase
MSDKSSSQPTPQPQPEIPAAYPWRSVGLALVLVVAVLVLLAASGLLRNVWVQVVLLGIVEGITEFLPISSTAHLLIVADLLDFQYSIDGTFEIFIQLGATLAVVAFYFRALLEQARAVTTSAEVRRFWLGIVIAFLPAAFIGLALRDWIKTVLFESPIVIACSLIIGGIIFIIVERRPREAAKVDTLTGISFKQALGIGFAQVTALIPGVSRSGASIVGGMFAGLDRPTATAFSFYLSIPTLGGATVFDLLTNLDKVTTDDLGRLFVGTVVSGIVAWISIGWLLRYVASNNFIPFGIYRIIIGALILALVAWGVL